MTSCVQSSYRPFCTNSTQCSELEPPPSKKLKAATNHTPEAKKHVTIPSENQPHCEEVKIVSSKDQYLWDSQHTKYLDLAGSAALVGHCNAKVVQASTSQMAILNTNSRFLNDRIVTYAKHLCSKLPDSLSCCFFTNSGSEANDLALQIAQVVTDRNHTVALQGARHGGLMSIKHLNTSSKAPNDVTIAPLPDCYRGEYTESDTAGKHYAEDLIKLMEDKTVAAFIHESIITGCAVVPPTGYLHSVYKHVRGVGGLCIADELETGFGRLGQHMWGFEKHGVCPDILTLGNCMGNGHPVAAVVTTKDIANKFSANGMEYFNTFGGNPVSMAIAEAVLCVVEEKDLPLHSREMGDRLMASLRALKEKHSCIGDVRGSGLYLAVDFVKSSTLKQPAPDVAQAVQKLLLTDDKIVTDVAECVLTIKPPLIVTRADCELVATALDNALTKLHNLTQ